MLGAGRPRERFRNRALMLVLKERKPGDHLRPIKVGKEELLALDLDGVRKDECGVQSQTLLDLGRDMTQHYHSQHYHSHQHQHQHQHTTRPLGAATFGVDSNDVWAMSDCLTRDVL